MAFDDRINQAHPIYDGIMLPKFSKTTDMREIRHFASREQDILICSYPKTGRNVSYQGKHSYLRKLINEGTNWIFEITSMLLKGEPEYNPKFKMTSMLEAVDIKELEEMEGPRLLNTHLPFQHIPLQHIENRYKIIHILRNPKDVMVSLYNHCKRDPSLLTVDFPGTWDNFFLDQCTNVHNFYGGFFNYEKEWERAKNTEKVTDVHTVFYEDMKRDQVKEIARLAKYLEVKINDEMIQEIAEKCSFETLCSVVSDVKEDAKKITAESADGTNYLFRKGTIGDWKNWFTVSQNEVFDALLEKELKNTDLQFAYE